MTHCQLHTSNHLSNDDWDIIKHTNIGAAMILNKVTVKNVNNPDISEIREWLRGNCSKPFMFNDIRMSGLFYVYFLSKHDRNLFLLRFS